jgi:16S rRNA (adenine1518-N6/adenine1519-N6)-dimethyltransferase
VVKFSSPASGGRLPRPRKRFGQHFLEPAWVTKVVDALDARPGDTFVEIGPGRGALTRALAPRVARLVAVEIDRELSARLAATSPPHVTILTADFLEVDLPRLIPDSPGPVRVVGNLPYNVGAPILFALFGWAAGGSVLSDATEMLQREVADRIVASPGTGEYGVLTVYTNLHAKATRLLTLPPGAFRPPPQVTSTVLRLAFHPPPVDIGRPETFDRIVRGTFAHRRKTLVNALRPAAEALNRDPAVLISRAGLDPGARPGDLALADFSALSLAVL